MRKPVFYCAVAGLGIAMVSNPIREEVHAQAGVQDFEAPVVFQAAGPTIPSIQSMVDQYRAALGAPNASNPGPLQSGRREINWDGGGAATSPAPTPFNGFLNTRGASFTTNGTGFVQAPVSGMADTFNNSSYSTIFQAFSPQRLFSPVGSNVTDVSFFIPGTNGSVPATTTGFGAVFSDVDRQNQPRVQDGPGNQRPTTVIEYYGLDGTLLFSSTVPSSPGNASLSFLGVVFSDARVAAVRIRTGSGVPGADDGEQTDIVMMDDFLFGEPRVIQ